MNNFILQRHKKGIQLQHASEDSINPKVLGHYVVRKEDDYVRHSIVPF